MEPEPISTAASDHKTLPGINNSELHVQTVDVPSLLSSLQHQFFFKSAG